MDNVLKMAPYIVLTIALGVLVFALVLRRNLRTEIKAKDDALKMKQNEFDELRLLAAGVTHEINNAISIILGRADQAIRRNEDPDQEKGLLNIKTTADRIVTSVKGLRQFIYPDTKQIEEYIELPVLMTDVMKLAGQRLRNHGIEIRLRGVENKFCKGRKAQLEQLIINLLNQSVERVEALSEKWVQLVAVDELGHLNIYFMDSSGGVGDKISQKQFSEILESNHGHLIINQNNLVMELPKPNITRFHS